MDKKLLSGININPKTQKIEIWNDDGTVIREVDFNDVDSLPQIVYETIKERQDLNKLYEQ
jgi:hypothetical protein